MINMNLIRLNEYSSIGEDGNDNNNCRNEVTFDSENLVITSSNKDGQLCAILFELDEDFIKELKLFVNVLAETYD